MRGAVGQIVRAFDGLVEEESQDCRGAGDDKEYANKRCGPAIGARGLACFTNYGLSTGVLEFVSFFELIR
jgi:hypothetical protein